MNEPHHRLGDLPAGFHSEETGLPFQRCNDCAGPLDDSEEGYVIQKVVSSGETILELAVCASCHEALQQSYSRESRERIWDFYLDHGDIGCRLRKFLPIPAVGPDPWINHCLTCGAARSSLAEYAIAGHSLEDGLVYGETPMMVCATCLEKIVGLLSEESRDTYDKWMDRVVPGAPETADDKPRVRVFL